MSDTDRGQVTAGAAEVYEAFFVPALFAQWTDVVLDVATVGPGHHVLDVGCGTGVLARAARARVGGTGRVAGVDPNEDMLALARRADPGVEWRTGVAERLPFPDHTFDRTVSQFALMFVGDPRAALADMARVTRPGGRVALAVWGAPERAAGYARLADLVEDLFGSRAADAIRAPFRLGDPDALTALAADFLGDPELGHRRGVARFSSLEAWLHTEIRGWTLADSIDDDDLARLLATATDQLADLVGRDGVAFDVSAIVVSGAPA
jgi:SAM-dependent methyltransferase